MTESVPAYYGNHSGQGPSVAYKNLLSHTVPLGDAGDGGARASVRSLATSEHRSHAACQCAYRRRGMALAREVVTPSGSTVTEGALSRAHRQAMQVPVCRR